MSRNVSRKAIESQKTSAVGDEVAAWKRAYEVRREAADATGDDGTGAERAAAFERFAASGFPTTRHEDWRWFNLAPIRDTEYQPVVAAAHGNVTPDAVARLAVADLGGPRWVFVDGWLVPELSRRVTQPELDVVCLSQARRNGHPALAGRWGRIATETSNPFLALNGALWSDGVLAHVHGSYASDEPLHLLFVSSGAAQPRAHHPRVLVTMDPSSHLSIVQEHVGLATADCFVNPVTEVDLGDGAVLDYTKLTHESTATSHVAIVAFRQARDSRLTANSVTWNGRRTRNDVRVQLAGEGAHCSLNGLIVLDGDELVDDHTRIDHVLPHTTSEERYKAILSGKSRGAFNGAIHVAPAANQINSQQTSKNLLLSDEALMNTKPELQILSDDVKCSHGATIGQLDEDALFYMRSRGLDEKTARRILVHAFGSEIVDGLAPQALVDALRSELFEDLSVALRR